MSINSNRIKFVEEFIEDSVLPTLKDYIKIPCVSLAYKEDWQDDIDSASKLLVRWLEKYLPEDATLEVQKGTKLGTPTILCHLPKKGSNTDKSLLLYGHFDKQPEMLGWDDDLGPFKPVVKDGKLYGRGSADDGYSIFSSLTAVLAANSRPEILLLFESSEESGSVDLTEHLELLETGQFEKAFNNIGTVICLDSGALTFDRLWKTTSLRGNLSTTLKVEVATAGTHSGAAGGIVPSAWIITNQMLQRIVDFNTQKVLLAPPEISEEIEAQLKINANILKDTIKNENSVLEEVKLLSDDVTEVLTNNNYGYAMEVVGFKGAPLPEIAGNVHQPYVEVKLSFRLPPTCDGKELVALLQKVIQNPPFNAKVSLDFESEASAGWHIRPGDATLEERINIAWQDASKDLFGESAGSLGEGGTIPFINMLQDRFPDAVFLVTGVLGPHSNAHGPNEFLHIDYTKKLTVAIAQVLENL